MGLPLGLTPPSALWPDPTSAHRGGRRDPGGHSQHGWRPRTRTRVRTSWRPTGTRTTCPWATGQGSQTRGRAYSGSTPPRGPCPAPTHWPPLAGPFLPRPAGQATTITHARTVPGPADGAPDSGGRSGPQRAAGVSDGGGAHAVHTPSVDPDPVGPAVGAPAPPTPAEEPNLSPRRSPPRWEPRRGSWRQITSHHRGPHLRIPLEACPLGRGPGKKIGHRRMRLDQVPLAHIPGPTPPPTLPACGYVPCHGARASGDPHRQDGAACSP